MLSEVVIKMEITCLGVVHIDEEIICIVSGVPRPPEIESCRKRDNKGGVMTEIPVGSGLFKLGRKLYVHIITDENKVDWAKGKSNSILEKSRAEAQRIGEVKEFNGENPSSSSIVDAMVNRLWLYDGKIYQLRKNYYDKERVRLLILDYLGKEEAKFKVLEKKFKKK